MEVGRIKTSDDLLQIKEDYISNQKRREHQMLACGGAGCISSHCQEVQDALEESLKVNGLEGTVRVIVTGCMGTCAVGLVLLVEPSGIFYTSMTLEKIADMVARRLVNRETCEEYAFYDSYKEIHIPKLDDADFFKRQVRIALHNCGHMEFTSTKAYVVRDGYQPISRALLTISQADMVEQIKASSLRGRDGVGFPADVKWDAGVKAISKNGIKYMVCNTDEGDSGTFTDRSLLEGDPHSIIEGMMIGGYATGASRGLTYVRAEYPSAAERLFNVVAQARETELLGSDILRTGFSFDLEIRIGTGVFVCGEETSLLSLIEGRRNEPRQEPPSSFESGLFNELTAIDNVETLANTVPIILHGADQYRQFSTEKSAGTKVFVLAGDIENPSIIEIPVDILLGNIVYKIGGGIEDSKKFKATQSGSPPGGYLICKHLNTKVDYESPVKLGAIMGSGGLVVMNEGTCIADTARYFMDFIRDESCGECLPYRNDAKRMLEILGRIIEGKEKEGDLKLLEELVETIRQTTMYGLRQTAPNPVLPTLKYFWWEYETHIYDKHYGAGVCAKSQESPCRNACPAYVCVPGCIFLPSAGRIDEAYQLIHRDNSFPFACGRIYTHPYEDHCRHGQVSESISICSLKRFIGDHAPRDDYTIPWTQSQPTIGRKVSIIGAGPFGLICAYHLTSSKHQVDVCNSEPVAGGVLYWDILEYRLSKKVLAKEVKAIEMAGANIHLNTRIGDDISFEQLRTNSDIIYVVIGTQESRPLDVPDEDLKGVENGLVFLECIGLKRDMDMPRQLVIIGGGSTVMDVARTVIRLGSEEVTIVYRRTKKEIPVGAEETVEAREEGADIITMVSPREFLGGDGKATATHLMRRELADYGRDGRRISRRIEGFDFNLEYGDIVTAVDQNVDCLFYRTASIDFGNWGRVGVNQFTTATSKDGVSAGGDVSPWGGSVVITAIADGKRAASNIDRYLGGSSKLNRGQTIEIPDVEGFEVTEPHKRFPVRTPSPKRRKNSFKKVACGFHKLDTMAGVLRCLHCDRK